MSAKLGVGLLGYGVAGEFFHAPLIAATPRLELRAIATSDPGRAARAAAVAPVVGSADAVLRDPAIDLVIVATPPATHVPLATAALQAGRHVVVDKPFAPAVAAADALIALAAHRRRVLVPYHNRRWDGDFTTVRDVIASGRLGRLVRYESWFDRHRPALRAGWREAPGAGAGLLFDLGSHLLDQLLHLFGEPDDLDADLACVRTDSPLCDHFEVRCRYAGLHATVGATTIAASARPRFALHGTEASYVKCGLDPQEAQLRAGRRPGEPGFGVEAPPCDGVLVAADGTRTPVPTAAGDYAAFYAGVAAAILDGAPPPVEPADARRGVALIELAERSSREGRRFRVREG